jgi:DNA-binding NtrC family response regulator
MDTEQSELHDRPVVAIVNTSRESIEQLEKVFAEQGFACVSEYCVAFKRGEQDLEAFFQKHRPQAVIWDIALPYVQNWQFFQAEVLTRQFLPKHCFIVTTANRTVLEILVGPTAAYELIGRPLDMQAIVDAVKRVVGIDPTSD